MPKKNFNYLTLIGIVILISIFYTVILYFLGRLYNLIHPIVGIYANSFWYIMVLILVLNARLFKTEEMKGVDEDSIKYFEEYIIGTMIAAMVSFPFHFAYLCETIQRNKPLSFGTNNIDLNSLYPRIRYSWNITLDTLTLGISGTYDVLGEKIIAAKTTLSKTVVLIYKISIALLYVVSILNIRKEIKLFTIIRNHGRNIKICFAYNFIRNSNFLCSRLS